MRLHFEHVVPRSTADLFNVVGDPSRRPEWNASVRNLEVLTPGPPRIGTRWREQTWGFGTFTIEIVEYDPPRRFAEVTVESNSDLWLELELTPIGSANTLVRVEAGGGMTGWRRLPQRLLRPLMPTLVRADLDRTASR